jgi:hypothetical protein
LRQGAKRKTLFAQGEAGSARRKALRLRAFMLEKHKDCQPAWRDAKTDGGSDEKA